MDIQAFVASTLSQICNGIRDAQTAGGAGFIVAPPLDKAGELAKNDDERIVPSMVHFNLKVTVESSGGSMSIKIMDVSFSKDTGKGSKKSPGVSTVQEIDFDIPVIWPSEFKQEKHKPLRPRREPYDPYSGY